MFFTKKVRGIALFLLFTMMLTSLMSCGDQEEPDTRTKIVENGVSPYTVVYPKNASPEVKDAVNVFVEAIAGSTGVQLPVKTDEIKRGGVYNSASLEILFGRTGYDETEAALDTVENGQFVICEIGNKLVYTAPKDADLPAMLEYFKAELLNQNLSNGEGGKTLAFQPYTSPAISAIVTEAPATVVDVSIGGNPISTFSIVYSESDLGIMQVITEFREEVEKRCGVRLPVYVDTNYQPKGAEILFGNTNRQRSGELYNERNPEMLSYEVNLQGNQLQLLYGGLFSARSLVRDLVKQLNILKTDGDYLKTDLATKEEALHEDADLRIMTSNVLSARWGEKDSSEFNVLTPPTAMRVEIFASMLAHYQPDVVGMQEACEVWGENLPKLLDRLKEEYGIEYTWIHNTYNGKLNMTSILYRSDKLELLETEAQPYSYWSGDYYIRIMVWANFRVKANPEQVFTMINTHWELSERIDKVQKCINEEIAKINILRKTYGYPLVATGDFKSRQDTDDYYRFMEEAHLTETRVEAGKVGGLINKAGGCGQTGKPRGANSGNYIDHIYTTEGFSALRYETVINNMTYWMTDHSPMIADIKFS